MCRIFLDIFVFVTIGILTLCFFSFWSDLSIDSPVYGLCVIAFGICPGVYYAGVRHRRRFSSEYSSQREVEAKALQDIKRRGIKELPALSSDGKESFWEPFDLNPLPIKPRYKEGISTDMDGEPIEIIYEDAELNITQRIIVPYSFQYSQQGREIFPYSVKALCQLRGDWRTFLVRRIRKATTMDGQAIKKADLLQFLILHSDIPRHEGGEEKSVISLIKPRVLLLVGYADRARKPTKYVLHLSSMSVINERISGQVVMTIKKLTGYCERLQRERSINYDRIISMCNPDTGEIIEDQVGFLEAHRAS